MSLSSVSLLGFHQWLIHFIYSRSFDCRPINFPMIVWSFMYWTFWASSGKLFHSRNASGFGYTPTKDPGMVVVRCLWGWINEGLLSLVHVVIYMRGRGCFTWSYVLGLGSTNLVGGFLDATISLYERGGGVPTPYRHHGLSSVCFRKQKLEY